MIGDDVVRRLPLLYKRGDYRIQDGCLMLRQIYADTRSGTHFFINSLSINSAVFIFMRNGTEMLLLRTSSTDIRCFIKSDTLLLFEILATLVADGARRAFPFTDEDLVTDIGTLASKTPCTEVMRVVKYPPRMNIVHAVKPDFFGNSGRIFTEEFSDILKGFTFLKGSLNVLPVRECQMFLITRN